MRTIFKRLRNANLHPAIVRRNSLPDSLWGKMHNLTFYGLFQSWRNNLNVHKEFHTRILSLYVTGWLGSGLNIFTFSAHLSFSVVWLAGPATPQWACAGRQLATPQWAYAGCQLVTDYLNPFERKEYSISFPGNNFSNVTVTRCDRPTPTFSYCGLLCSVRDAWGMCDG